MTLLTAVIGAALIVLILIDVFETVVLPRRVTHPFRLTRAYYRLIRWPFRVLIPRLPSGVVRETILASFGPGSLLFLLVLWAVGLIVGFATLLRLATPAVERRPFGTELYFSGTTFFTLGLGDLTPVSGWTRLLTVAEVGMGFGLLALVIGYLPALFQAVSRREVSVSLLDARAGSPPTGVELVRRHAGDGDDVALGALEAFLAEWERSAADLMESHLSYPILTFFRSQHDNQSWVAALTAILDACALLLVGIDECRPVTRQARLTFALCRHAVVDLAQVLNIPPRAPETDRLPPDALAALRAALGASGLTAATDAAADAKLTHLRELYEPYVAALAANLVLDLPPWIPPVDSVDNWKATAWEPNPRGSLL